MALPPFFLEFAYDNFTLSGKNYDFEQDKNFFVFTIYQTISHSKMFLVIHLVLIALKKPRWPKSYLGFLRNQSHQETPKCFDFWDIDGIMII